MSTTRAPEAAPCGSWRSPITAALIAAGTTKLADLVVDGDQVYWVEVRPAENGRSVIVRGGRDGRVADVLPPPYSARSRVHEYGGGAFTVADGVAYFSSDPDQRLHRLRLDRGVTSPPEPITPEGAYRYADIAVDRTRDRLVCVREDHTATGREPVNTLVSVRLDAPGAPRVLVEGADFFASPRLSPDGSALAWVSWRHPNMPWHCTELWSTRVVADGSLGKAERIAGGSDESIVQPEWSPDGVLHFVSDRSGWWNLYAWRDGAAHALCPIEAELAYPPWIFGVSTYAFVSPGEIVCAYASRGRWMLGRLDATSGTLRQIDLPYTEIKSVRVLASAPVGAAAVMIAAAPDRPPAIVRCDLDTETTTIVRASGAGDVDPAHWSMPQPISCESSGGATAFAFYYPPHNPAFRVQDGERPPLIVMSHGGPNAAASTGLNLRIQYWTSRGFAVVDVDYRGSTGYGTAYRRQLDGQWGVADVEDCIAAARFLAATGRADPRRLAITGSSAGGYTTLCALTFHDVFHAGASYYGISDLEALAADTHKFEAHYHERLIGPYPARRDLYRARSPIHFAERLACPVIFFQGSDDKVVLPNQAERMVDALHARGVAVDLVVFDGEGHGFRRADTIATALEAELAFYTRVLGLTAADARPGD